MVIKIIKTKNLAFAKYKGKMGIAGLNNLGGQALSLIGVGVGSKILPLVDFPKSQSANPIGYRILCLFSARLPQSFSLKVLSLCFDFSPLSVNPFSYNCFYKQSNGYFGLRHSHGSGRRTLQQRWSLRQEAQAFRDQEVERCRSLGLG